MYIQIEHLHVFFFFFFAIVLFHLWYKCFLQVPQHYKLMGYDEVPVYGSKSSFALTKQCKRLLRETQVTQLHSVIILLCILYLILFSQSVRVSCVLQSKLLPTVTAPDLNSYTEKELQGEDRAEPDLNPGLVFRAPPYVLKPQNAHPLRIFVNTCLYISCPFKQY